MPCCLQCAVGCPISNIMSRKMSTTESHGVPDVCRCPAVIINDHDPGTRGDCRKRPNGQRERVYVQLHGKYDRSKVDMEGNTESYWFYNISINQEVSLDNAEDHLIA